MLAFQNIPFSITNPPLKPISIEELSVVENELGFLFPDDYREFVIVFGSGEIDLGVRVISPQNILGDWVSETRDRLAKFWFWHESPISLTQARAIECVPFFDSPDGDDILFHPSNRNRWFILPHERDEIIVVQSFRELCDHYAQKRADGNGNPMQPPFNFSRYT